MNLQQIIAPTSTASQYLWAQQAPHCQPPVEQAALFPSSVNASTFARPDFGLVSSAACPSPNETYSPVDVVSRLSYGRADTNPDADVISLKLSRLASLSLLRSRIKRANSTSTIGSSASRGSRRPNVNISDQQSLTNSMIAKLALSAGGSSSKPSGGAEARKNSGTVTSVAARSAGPSQCKRKRQKVLDLLLHTNWCKQSQQAANLNRLNKALLVCDANFLDEKTGESPLSLAITSSQINATPIATNSASRLQAGAVQVPTAGAIGCPQSASLFNLQFQHPSSSRNQLTLQQTSAADISQSKAPLVEKILLLLIKSGAQIDFRNNDGRTPLHMAAMKSNSWALKTLLDQGASTDCRDINGLTPLYYSILFRAELKVTQLLLNHMSNRSLSAAGDHSRSTSNAIGICDQQGWQEVHHACKLGLDAHLDKLLYYGCDINAKISGSGNTPLHVAAINDQLQVAKVLLLRGADRSITNNSHQTAHQVAVISSNMDLAEFIASHDEKAVVPFAERPNNRRSFILSSACHSNDGRKSLQQFSLQPHQNLVGSQSSSQISSSVAKVQTPAQTPAPTPTLIIQAGHNHQHLNPLTLDVACHLSNGACSAASSAPSTGTSGTGHHTAQSSLLSINSSTQNHHLDAQSSNISPSLSQRSSGTSNTTSSGVCCEAEGNNSDLAAALKTHQSNISVVSISNANKFAQPTDSMRSTSDQRAQSEGVRDPAQPLDLASKDENSKTHSAKASDNENHHADQDEDELSSSESSNSSASGASSSSNGLYSLMSTSRPLFVGSIVEATTDYQSGDPSHLQLRRKDMIEVLEYLPELLQAGQLPRLANKPMLYGRRQTDGTSGLFPSFCVRRTKQRQSSLRQRIPVSDLTNSSSCQLDRHALATNGPATFSNEQSLNQAVRGTNLPESQSMAAIGELNKQQCENLRSASKAAGEGKLNFRHYQVVLTKINDGFGFVLRGARINPATLSAQSNFSNGRIAIDEQLMIANNLASLQYLDDIETGSVAQKAGLKRGDFLVAVNGQDVRLCSHENVVQVIRSSGDRVHLTIATPAATPPAEEILSTRTLTRVKPEPPKRDPTTTLTRNKSQQTRSMSVAPQFKQQQQEQQQTKHQGLPFDANKPLPEAPANHVGSSRQHDNDPSSSANISHLNSTTSLSSAAPDTKSITSISGVGSVDGQRHQEASEPLSPINPNLDQSSSSTATLTTVATNKPEAPAKPSSIYLKGVAMRNLFTQSSYQPAAVMTSHRQKVQGQVALAAVESPPEAAVVSPASQLPPPPPPPPLPTSLPPPPPPLPNFNGNAASKSCLSQRRTSAPLNQVSNLDGASRLLKKRESLAVVSADRQADGAAPICAVAAACAAAANSRLQRQQQKQQDGAEKRQPGEQGGKPEVRSGTKSEPSVDTRPRVPEGFDQDGTKELSNTEPATSFDSQSTTNHCKHEVEITKPGVVVKREQAPVVQSATLGRKSSAQIIQQPKQQQHPAHSQTLRAVSTPKRISILDYDMSQLPPPPAVPAQQPVSTRPIAHDINRNSHQPPHIHPHDEIRDENLVHASLVNGSQDELAQRQLHSQHQLILRRSQHLRQQQLFQERLMLQQQAQHRLCKHSHGTSAEHQYSRCEPRSAAETAGVASHVYQHHHPQNHRKHHHQPMSLEASGYSVNQHHDQCNHNHASVAANMQHYHEQQQHTQQTRQQNSHHRQAPSCNQYSQRAVHSSAHHTHRHSSHIQQDRSRMLHEHHQQHQKLLQQQQHHQQYLQYVESMPFSATRMDR